MKLTKVTLLPAFLCLESICRANTSDFPNQLCQFDKSTMIKEKLKKARECINNGDYSTAKNYLRGVLRLDSTNAKAKELLDVCNNGGKSTTPSRSNGANKSTSSYNLSVSKSDLSFNSSGGTETITVSSASSWSISVNPTSWGHLTRNGNSLIVKVDANTSIYNRTDFFKLKSGSHEIRVNVVQSGTQIPSTPYLNVSKIDLYFASDGGQESITISSNNNWKVSTSTNSWGHLKYEGNTLTLTVDANNTGKQRTDYFVLKSGDIEKRINITQSQTYAKNGVAMYGTTRAYTDNVAALSYLTTCIKGWKKCILGAITEKGAGIVVYGENGYATTGNLNSNLVSKIKELNGKVETFKSIAVTNSGYYCLVYGINGWYGNIPSDMSSKLTQFNTDVEDIYCVSIAENGDYVIVTDKHVDASNTADLTNMKNTIARYGHIQYTCITNRGIIVVCQNGIYYSNIPTNLEVILKSITFKPGKIIFTDSGTYLITSKDEVYNYRM